MASSTETTARSYPTYANYRNGGVAPRPPETSSDIQELWKECSAIHAQITSKKTSQSNDSRRQERQALMSLKSRLQELQCPRASGSSSSGTPPTPQEDPKDCDPYLTWRPMQGSKTMPTPPVVSAPGAHTAPEDDDLTSTAASYNEVRNEIAHMLGGYSIPASHPDTHDLVRNEIVNMLGSYSKTPPTDAEGNEAPKQSELQIPMTNLSLGKGDMPLARKEVSPTDMILNSLSDLNVSRRMSVASTPSEAKSPVLQPIRHPTEHFNIGSAMDIGPALAIPRNSNLIDLIGTASPTKCSPSLQTATRSSTETFRTESEALERISHLKAEITKERKLQARTIEDTTCLEESHMRDVEQLRKMLEEGKAEQKKLEAQAAIVECRRFSDSLERCSKALDVSSRSLDVSGKGSTTALSEMTSGRTSIESDGRASIQSQGRCSVTSQGSYISQASEQRPRLLYASELPPRRHRNSEPAILSSSLGVSRMISPTARTPTIREDEPEKETYIGGLPSSILIPSTWDRQHSA